MSESINSLKKFGKSFFWAGKILPNFYFKRSADLYHFCRKMDDIADENQNIHTLENLKLIKSFIQKETIAYIAAQVAAAGASDTFYNYTHNATLTERDVGHEIEAIRNDISHGGNKNTHEQASKYWTQTTPYYDGTRAPEVALRNWIVSLVNNYVLKNVAYTSQQSGAGAVSQNVILSLPESGVSTRVTNLMFIISDVIQNGLDNLPIKESVPLDKSFGDAHISDKHCNFFVNKGNASFKDMKKLINFVEKSVFKKTGINIEKEIKILEN